MKSRETSKFKKNLMSMGLMYVANYALPLLTMPYVARVLGPDKFGLVNYSQSYIQYFGLLVNFGFELSASRRIAASRGDKEATDTIFNETLFTKITLLGISFILFLFITLAVPSFWAERYLHIATFVTCVSYCLYPTWFYQGMEDMTKTAIFNVLMKFFFTSLIFLMVKTENDYVYHNLAISVGQVIIAVIALFVAIRKYRIVVVVPAITKIVTVIKTYRLLFFSTVVVNLYTGTNIFILGMLSTPNHVGFFSSAHKVVIIGCLFVTGAFGQAFYPYIAREFSTSRSKGLKIVKKIIPKIASLTALLSIGIFIVADYIIKILFGAAFEDAVIVLRILAFQPFIISISNLLGVQTMLNLQLDKVFYKITLGGAILGTALNFILVPYYFEIGTACAWVITELAIAIAMYFSLRENGYNLFQKNVYLPSTQIENV
ncbi:flippase [Spirosoma linguale]|uniref:Polysaccharide biosynthesis protein n=1 Tax=Spirosoma linguale (strain ATCC 33905 / DSM 74 / LMG 10896 / Claus 1) TaxID=504472 RepID=D2QU76_SPILD|nr:polysaccharide biosynthesis protein [Spirosoma linguale DSM 74]